MLYTDIYLLILISLWTYGVSSMHTHNATISIYQCLDIYEYVNNIISYI